VKRFYLVRHAQTAWNNDHRIQGHSDVPLNPAGEAQAKRLGALFATRHLTGIFTSHLLRSQQTAQHIAAGNGHGVQPVIEQRLAEMHLGAWEGLTPEEVDARFAGAYQQWRVRPSTVQIPGAEQLEAFRQRVSGAFEHIVSSAAEGEYVIVSHGGVIAALLAKVLGADYDALLRRLRLDNAGITALECGTTLRHVLWINATGHLTDTAALPPLTQGGWF
jgi:broad specificity phosphatase PhoE